MKEQEKIRLQDCIDELNAKLDALDGAEDAGIPNPQASPMNKAMLERVKEDYVKQLAALS
jgi:hypothetical protein